MNLELYFRHIRRLMTDLPRRAQLTIQEFGRAELLRRLVAAPLRFLPGGALGAGPGRIDASGPARAWYRRSGRPALVVIPSFGDPRLAEKAVRSVRRTTDASRTRIVVCDDASPSRHVTALRTLAARTGIEIVLGEEQLGFSANCNRGIRLLAPDEDLVLLNSDVIARRGWLAALQYAAYRRHFDLVGARLLYPDGKIQFGGLIRNEEAPRWFDHRFRFKPADHPPANVGGPTLAATGACLYVRRDAFDELGELDEGYGMAFEDVDYAMRAWVAGRRVGYAPESTLIHHESQTRGAVQGDREVASQDRFWSRWGDTLDRRDVRAEDGGLRIIYVTQDTGIGGGHRVIFTHLNGLLERGHHPELWTLASGGPDWFDLNVPIRRFRRYHELARELAQVEAIKVATWWETSPWVWEASVTKGIPVYLVQDIETAYYSDAADHAKVLASYRPGFAYLAGSAWVRDELTNLGVRNVATFTPGLDTATYRELGIARSDHEIVSTARSNPLKGFSLTRAAYERLASPRPALTLFGTEPELAVGLGDGVAFHRYPSDTQVNELYNRATVLVQTSRHEGFCLPPLEAMAAGAAVICTDANGNRDFCRDEENCLVPAPEPAAVALAIRRLLGDPDLRTRLAVAGRETAASYAWPRKLDALEQIYLRLSEHWSPHR